MVLFIVGVILILFSVMVYFTAQPDFKENPWLVTPYEDEAMMILITQKVTSAILDVMYLGVLFLGASMIVKGLGSLM